jgi:hypothetical protein
MTTKRKSPPTDLSSESALGEEDPGAALEMSMSEPAPQGRPTPDTPLESPLPRTPTLEREEPPKPAREEDIAPEDDAPSGEGGEKGKGRPKLKKPGARGSGGARKRG